MEVLKMSENYENNVLSMLIFGNRRQGAWISVASFASVCNINPGTVRRYLTGSRGNISQIAAHYHYDYRIRTFWSGATAAWQMASVYRGYF